jgi:hypothetical protein
MGLCKEDYHPEGYVKKDFDLFLTSIADLEETQEYGMLMNI